MMTDGGRRYRRIFWSEEVGKVIEDDSKEEKSGNEVGSCVKGSQIRKQVTPTLYLSTNYITR